MSQQTQTQTQTPIKHKSIKKVKKLVVVETLYTPTPEYKIAIEKFHARTKGINQRMIKEIQEYESEFKRKNCLGGGGICGARWCICKIRERHKNNAYQRKRKFEKKWGY